MRRSSQPDGTKSFASRVKRALPAEPLSPASYRGQKSPLTLDDTTSSNTVDLTPLYGSFEYATGTVCQLLAASAATTTSAGAIELGKETNIQELLLLLNEVEDMIGNMLKGLDSDQVADGNEANMAFEASKLQLGWLRELRRLRELG